MSWHQQNNYNIINFNNIIKRLFWSDLSNSMYSQLKKSSPKSRTEVDQIKKILPVSQHSAAQRLTLTHSNVQLKITKTKCLFNLPFLCIHHDTVPIVSTMVILPNKVHYSWLHLIQTVTESWSLLSSTFL